MQNIVHPIPKISSNIIFALNMYLDHWIAVLLATIMEYLLEAATQANGSEQTDAGKLPEKTARRNHTIPWKSNTTFHFFYY